MRVQRSISPTKEPGIGNVWGELRQRGHRRAQRVRRAWTRFLDVLRASVRERRWWSRACLAIGCVLALVVLGGVGYRAQVGRRLARAVQHRLGRGPYAAFVEPERSFAVLWMSQRSALPTLYLEMAPGTYQALSMQQQRARRTGILWPQDARAVTAVLTVAGEGAGRQQVLEGRSTAPREVQVRLAGSRCDGVPPLDQWHPHKWSLEVQLSPPALVFGADAFTLASPALRAPAAGGYLDAWLYRLELYKAGLVPSPSRLVYLVLNGESWGVYLLEPELDPGGEAWFESLDAERRGRLLAHADLWGQEIPGSCQRGGDAAGQARRVLEEDPRARAAYESEAARISRREYVEAMRTLYRQTVERCQRLLDDEFFSAYLGTPWDRLFERQAWLAARADGAAWEGAADLSPDRAVWPPLTSAEMRAPSIQSPAVLPSVEQVLEQHPFLARSDRPGFLRVKPGDWRVAGDLVLPPGVGLDASEPFTLRFERGAMLVAHAPLIFNGPDAGAIRLLPLEDHWAGVRVLRADPATSSSWRNVEVLGVRGAQPAAGSDPGRAGILFYESPISLDRCRVMDGYAAAALAILRAPFEIRESEFGAASGDLVQVHAAQGTISRTAFHDALGAAVRLEGSAARIVGVSVQRVRGAAIWAGPESRVEVWGLRADRVGVGVETAGARAQVQDVRVGAAATACFLAHDGARLDVAAARFEDDSTQALVQAGSEAVLDGVPIAAQAFAVDDLRPPAAPSPPMTPLNVRFGPSIRLVGYELTTPERAPGETIEVILYWRAYAYLDRQYTIFMHVRDAAGETVAGWDMMPRYNTFPTTDWPLVERIDDVHIVPLSQDMPPGEYTLALGMYDWATGVRLPAYTRSGESLAEATVVLEKRVTVK